MLIKAGTVINKYTIIRQLGSGGMGAVYAANQEGLGRRVAIKVILPGLALDPKSLRDAEERFQREARTLAQLNDAQVVQVFDFGRHDWQGQPFLYMVMEFIDGGSWDAVIAQGTKIDLREHFGIARQAAMGLAAAEEEGIFHRDVKPGNIMVTRKGAVKVVDFGLSVDQASYKVTGHQAKGTPPMMAPEVWDGQPSDQRTDIYALGVSLWHAVTGSLPYQGNTLGEWMRHHCQTPVPTPSGIPPEVVALLHRMLAKNPQDRFQHHRDVVAVLDRLGATTDLRARAQAWFAHPAIDTTRLVRSFPAAGAAHSVDRRDRDAKGRKIVRLDEPIIVHVPINAQ